MINIEETGKKLDSDETPAEDCFKFYHDNKQSQNALVRTLAMFAGHVGNAKAARARSDIGGALRHEKAAQELYDSLPHTYRW